VNALKDHIRSAIDACATPGTQPLPVGDDGEPVFAEPWQAQVFASTVVLSQSGLFTWKRWVEAFSAEINARPQAEVESGTDAYFRQWLSALEALLATRGIVSREDIVETQEHWRRSYINTEHGHPVQFSRKWAAPRPETERWLKAHAHHHPHDHHHDEHDLVPRPIAVSPGRRSAA
jgi:nitrile hydratase accessory protein